MGFAVRAERLGRVGVVLVLALLSAGCAGGAQPLRLAVLVDCTGPFSGFEESMLASAEFPLLTRGGTLRGDHPSDGVEGPTVAGRRVTLLLGCADTKAIMLAEARRLVELEDADVVVGPIGPIAGLALREYARRNAEVAFVAGPTTSPELTLNDPAPNLFRFFPDAAQSTAGLGTYAFRELGWRSAALVGSDHPFEWAQAAGFVAEFCALGGTVESRLWAPAFSDEASLASRVPTDVDGVFVSGGIGAPAGFLARYASMRPPLRSHVVLGGAALLDPSVVGRLGSRLLGVVSAFTLPFELTPAERAYAARFREIFPGLPSDAATGILSLPYEFATEAVMQAFDRAGGRPGRPLLTALAKLELRSPLGSIVLDASRQAIAPNYLSRVETMQGKREIRTLRVVPGVDETFAGYFGPASAPPTRSEPGCRRSAIPPWARG